MVSAFSSSTVLTASSVITFQQHPSQLFLHSHVMAAAPLQRCYSISRGQLWLCIEQQHNCPKWRIIYTHFSAEQGDATNDMTHSFFFFWCSFDTPSLRRVRKLIADSDNCNGLPPVDHSYR